jgi:flagellar hook-associated protein 3 FlgL
MNASFVSTQFLGSALLQPVMQAQTALATAVVEESTGQYADLGLQLGDQSGYELSLRNQTDLLQTLTTSNSVISTNLGTVQTALNTIGGDAQTMLQSLAASPGAAQLQTAGASALQSLIDGANANSGGTYVFGGNNSSVPPMADYSSTPASSAQTAVDQAFQTTFGFPPSSPLAANITGSAMQSFLSGPFAALFQGASWSSNWSSASSTNSSAEIAPGETVATTTNTNQPGFSQLAQGYAMLSEFSGTSLSADAQQAVVAAATSLISQGSSSLTATEAGVGASLAKVTEANASMSSQLTILQTQIGMLDNVDQTALAATINGLTTQIQTAYSLTARLQSLGLAQYLPTPAA